MKLISSYKYNFKVIPAAKINDVSSSAIVIINYNKRTNIMFILIKRTNLKYRLNYDVGAIFNLMGTFSDINLNVYDVSH